jgi:3-hydroxybutyrate dehydrogenase
MSLKSRNAVVTGSTSGIGLAIAQALAKEGASVLLNGFGDAAAIEALRAGIEADFGVKCIYHAADMSKPAEIADMVATAEANLGSVDILVNNAGASTRAADTCWLYAACRASDAHRTFTSNVVRQACSLFRLSRSFQLKSGTRHVPFRVLHRVRHLPCCRCQIIAINMSAAFHAIRAAVPGMKARRWGCAYFCCTNP